MALLTGCRYESLEDYLKALGILDPMEYDDQVVIEQTEDVSSADLFEPIVVDDTKEEEAAAEYSSTDEPKDDETSLFEGFDFHAPDADFFMGYQGFGGSGLDADDKKKREDIGITDDGMEAKKRQQEGLYAYERLTDSGKTLYVEILTIMENLAEDVCVSTTSDEAIELVFDYCMADHPEIFYVDGYHYTNYSVGDTITKISFTGNYIYDSDEVKSRKRRINEVVNRALAKAPSSDDDYYAIRYVYEYLIENTDYDMSANDNQNICSVFLDGRSVCNGYAKAAQYLLGKLGISSTLVTGFVNTKNSSEVRHAWNLVRCNNAYYYFDVTWGDASYQTVSGESADASKLPDVNYDYLNVTTDEIERTHRISDEIYMPVCSSLTDNFYVREDEYFTQAELTLVDELFDRRYKDGSGNVTIKCATDEVYDELFEQLITEHRVFDYMQGDTSQISYTTFEDTRTIMFWL